MDARLFSHERRHALQCMVLGPLFPLAYAVASLVSAARGTGFYRGNAFEVDARNHETLVPFPFNW